MLKRYFKKKVFRLSFTLLCYSLLTNSLFAQVTIGLDEETEKAALLQIKNVKVTMPASVTDPSNASVDKDGGGFALPRVHLVDKTTLEPFIPIHDMDWIEAQVNKIKEKHAGLMVYNLTTTGDFEQGVYVWDGAQWNTKKIPEIDAWLKSGNAGTTAGTHFVGTTDAQGLAFKTNNDERMRITDGGTVGVGTANPLATAKLHVEGKMVITDTPEYSNANVMVIDNDGNVGIAAPESPINKVLYVQSSTNQRIDGTNLSNLNDAKAVVVTWAAGDISSYGGLMTFNPIDNTFTFNENALCEISGYVNYLPNATPPASYTNDWRQSTAALNVTVQYALSTLPDKWEDLTGARHIFVGQAVAGVLQTIHVPPAIRHFNKNDKIRLIIKRPDKIAGSDFALPHGANNFSSIGVPSGSKFSKGLKVTTM